MITPRLHVKVGLTYQRSDDRKVTILQHHQVGVSQHNLIGDDNDYYTVTGDSLHGRRRHLVKHLPQGKPVSYEQVKVGDIVTHMKDLMPTGGTFNDWYVAGLFTISTQMFDAMYAALGRHGMPVEHHAAYLVSAMMDHDGDIIDIMAIFSYSGSYACATLRAPHHI